MNQKDCQTSVRNGRSLPDPDQDLSVGAYSKRVGICECVEVVLKSRITPEGKAHPDSSAQRPYPYSRPGAGRILFVPQSLEIHDDRF